MGFLNTIGKGLQFGAEQLKKNKAEVEDYKAQYERYDDRRLMEMFQSSSGSRKLACGLLLKERGYGN